MENGEEPVVSGASSVIAAEMNETLPSANSTTVDSYREYGTHRNRAVRKYTRSDLEALRFVDAHEQAKTWSQIRQELECRVSQEYDELVENDQKKAMKKIENRKLWERKNEHAVGKSDPILKRQGEDIPGEDWNKESCISVEEEHDDDDDDDVDDDDDDYYSIQRPAFVVDGEPDYESGPPQDGWEYLRRVRWEAALMPKVKSAKVDSKKLSGEQTPYMPKIPEIAKCPEDLRPSKTWVDQFLSDFSHLRQAFSKLEPSSNPINLREDSQTSESNKNSPTLTAILNLDPVARAANLRNRVRAFESAGSLTRDDCEWFFALCVAVDSPLDAEMGSCMRRLLRKSSARLSKKTDPADEEIALLNILITISGKFFGQSEES